MKDTRSIVLIFAGSMIIGSVALSYFHSQYWLFLTLFVGLNLFQYGFSGFCPLEKIINKVRG